MRLLELFEQITPRRVGQMEQEFSCGSCMYLALVLNAKYNWPLAGVFGFDDADEIDNIVHIWVEPPGTKKAIDIWGVHDKEELENNFERVGKSYGAEYEHDMPPEMVKSYMQSGQIYYPRKDRMFYGYEEESSARQRQQFHKQALKQAYRAMQDYLLPQMQQQGLLEHESLLEDQAIRTYDPGVVEWIQKALQRPNANELYLHGSRQEQNVFDPESKTWEHSLLHFSKLTDPRFHDRPSQAEYYGPRLFLAKLKYKKPFDVRFPDSEAAQMLKELVPNAVTYRLDYSDIYKIIDPALKRGYDLFVIHEISVGTESYAVPNHKQVQVVDIYDSRKRVNESLADQLIDSKVARKFTYIAMAIKMHKNESVMVNLVERAVNEFLSRLKDGKYAKLEDAEHDRNTLLDMVNKVSNKLYLHDEIKQGSKTAQILAGSLNLARIGSFHGTQEPVDGSQAVNTPTLS